MARNPTAKRFYSSVIPSEEGRPQRGATFAVEGLLFAGAIDAACKQQVPPRAQ
jgi:hypothetical protein